jgi:hypothetical protein
MQLRTGILRKVGSETISFDLRSQNQPRSYHKDGPVEKDRHKQTKIVQKQRNKERTKETKEGRKRESKKQRQKQKHKRNKCEKERKKKMKESNRG